ncbi:MAG: lipopolysaccharide biosynthesis protein [Clostridiaceae bacterium]|nr:lipopolysaccharide biosynthesis protein [Clostridiaceae bacterium]
MTEATLKQKTITGFFWSFIDSFANQILIFIIGIILARLLTPKEFGLIGMIAIFISVSESFINSGFSQALIRKKACTDNDLSTVFFFNIIAGIFFFAILFFGAPTISTFFNEPQLKVLVRVLGTVLIIDALTIIQRTILTRRIDFKLQTKISVISIFFSGIVGISMAFMGFGVWSLVAKTLSQRGMNSLLLWLLNKWHPVLIFSKKSFRELFSFGSKLLASGLLDTIYRNIYYLVIGKYFSAQELGYYTRADQFKNLPSANVNGIISRVSYPVLSQLQDDPVKLKAGYKKLIKNTMFIAFVMMAGMAAVSEPMVITLIGEKWRPSIIYLQLLCFVGAMYPLHALNLNMLNVRGRSDLFLNLEIIKKILAIPTIIIGIIWGIKIMILGMWLNSIIAYYLNSFYSGRLIKYPMKEQVIDILPGFLLALLMGISVFLSGRFLHADYFVKLIVQVILGILMVLGIGELFKFQPYLELRGIVLTKTFKKNNVRQ